MTKRKQIYPPEYQTYNWMRQITQNPNHPEYPNYGALGITCDWPVYSYDDFYNWLITTLGPRPPGHVLGRKDKTGNYSRQNLEWQTPKQRVRTSPELTVMLTYRRQRRSLMHWSEHFGIPEYTMRRRIRQGWSLQDIIKAYK